MRPAIIRGTMWAILAAILVAWLIAAVKNPQRAQKVCGVAFSPDGSLLALGTDKGSAVLCDAVSGKRQAVLEERFRFAWTHFVAFTPDGAHLALGGDSWEVKLWDVVGRRLIRTLDNSNPGDRVNCGTFDSTGKYLATGGESDTIRIWDWNSDLPPREIITHHKQRINGIAWSPDGALIATASDDETVKLTEVASGDVVVTLFWDDNSEVNTGARAVAFSPDGKTLLSGMDHGTIVLWDLPSRSQRVVLAHGENTVGSVAFGRDGQHFATGNWDGTARVWDAGTNERAYEFQADSRWVWSVALSPDGRNLATGGDSATAKIWDLATGKSKTVVAEPSTVQWWILGILAWGTGFVLLRRRHSSAVLPAEDRTVPNRSEKLEPSKPNEPDWSGTPSATTICYGIGAMVYAMLCTPAINQRGFPPIDPVWTAVTFLWISPILLAAVLDPRPFRLRMRGLAIYCVATAFFDAAALVMVVPKHVTLLGTIMETVFMMGPYHLIVGFTVAGIANLLRSASRKLIGIRLEGATKWIRWIAFSGIGVATVAFPFGFRVFYFADLQNRGRNQAEDDWAHGRAVIYSDQHPDTGPVMHNFDPATGLKYKHKWPESEFSKAYNHRVAEFLAQGIPSWSMQAQLVPDDELLKMLDSSEMTEVKEFPHEVNENIVLFRRGTLSRWGGTMSSQSDSLSIGVKPGGLIGVGGEAEPAYVGRSIEYPNVIFIRSGRSWIGAFHESGEQLSSASRYDAPGR
jgi:hypothetical protein